MAAPRRRNGGSWPTCAGTIPTPRGSTWSSRGPQTTAGGSPFAVNSDGAWVDLPTRTPTGDDAKELGTPRRPRLSRTSRTPRPSPARGRVSSPVPQPTSRTDSPGPIAARSAVCVITRVASMRVSGSRKRRCAAGPRFGTRALKPSFANRYSIPRTASAGSLAPPCAPRRIRDSCSRLPTNGDEGRESGSQKHHGRWRGAQISDLGCCVIFGIYPRLTHIWWSSQ
jgi:hypothetical protein